MLWGFASGPIVARDYMLAGKLINLYHDCFCILKKMHYLNCTNRTTFNILRLTLVANWQDFVCV